MNNPGVEWEIIFIGVLAKRKSARIKVISAVAENVTLNVTKLRAGKSK